MGMLYYTDIKETIELIQTNLKDNWYDMNINQKRFIKNQTDYLLNWFSEIKRRWVNERKNDN